MTRTATCPICGQPIVEEARQKGGAPFCSERCRNVDLARWLNESYSTPVETERVVREHLDDLASDPSRLRESEN